MWNAPANTIPEEQIFREHMRVLESAIFAADEFPVAGADTLEALAYFRRRSLRQGGINLIMRGISENRIDWMHDGLALLKKHLGDC